MKPKVVSAFFLTDFLKLLWFQDHFLRFWWYFFFVTWFQGPKKAVFGPNFTISRVSKVTFQDTRRAPIFCWKPAYCDFRPTNCCFWTLKPSHKKKYHKNLKKWSWNHKSFKNLSKKSWNHFGFHENWLFFKLQFKIVLFGLLLSCYEILSDWLNGFKNR